MPIHLSQNIKSLIARQTFAARGFNKDIPDAKTVIDIRRARIILSHHLDQGTRLSTTQSWYVVVTAIYTTLNFPKGLRLLWIAVYEDLVKSQCGHDRRVDAAARMRETVMKCLPFLGVPRVLGALGALTEVQRQSLPPSQTNTRGGQDEQKEASRDPVWLALQSTRAAPLQSLSDMQSVGLNLWNDVYSPPELASKLYDKLEGWHPDLAGYITTAAYGYNLSPTRYIDRRETSMIAVACLRGEEDVMAQLTSHVYGLIKAGCTEDAARSIIHVVDGIRSGVFTDHSKKTTDTPPTIKSVQE